MSTTDNNKILQTFSPINATDRPAISPTYTNKFNRFKPRRILILLGFIIIVTVLGTVAANLATSSNETGASNQVRSVFSGEELKEYNSPENKFSVLMPGIPTIKESTNKAGEATIPITTYEKVIENGSKNYTFAVYDYSSNPFTDQPKALEAILNSAMQNTPNSQVSGSKTGKYNDLSSIEATYSVADKDKVYESHIRYVIKDNKLYSMILIGGDQAKFDQFANSLKLY